MSTGSEGETSGPVVNLLGGSMWQLDSKQTTKNAHPPFRTPRAKRTYRCASISLLSLIPQGVKYQHLRRCGASHGQEVKVPTCMYVPLLVFIRLGDKKTRR